MKKLTLLAIAAFALVAVACGGGEQATETVDTADQATQEEIQVLENTQAIEQQAEEANSQVDSILNSLK